MARRVSILTPREREVLRLVALGLDTKRIADELGIGKRTMHQHMDAITRALEVQGRVQSLIYVLQNPGVISGGSCPPRLHMRGCGCPGYYCTLMRSISVDPPSARL